MAEAPKYQDDDRPQVDRSWDDLGDYKKGARDLALFFAAIAFGLVGIVAIIVVLIRASGGFD